MRRFTRKSTYKKRMRKLKLKKTSYNKSKRRRQKNKRKKSKRVRLSNRKSSKYYKKGGFGLSSIKNIIKSKAPVNNKMDVSIHPQSSLFEISWIRHGFSKANERNYESRPGYNATHILIKDPPLNERGVIQSIDKGEELRNGNFDIARSGIVLCSAMKRAIETALFMFPAPAKIIVCPYLSETGGYMERDNKISSTKTRQLKNLGERIDIAKAHALTHVRDNYSYNSAQNFIEEERNRIDYRLVLEADKNSFKQIAKESDIPKFLEWFHHSDQTDLRFALNIDNTINPTHIPIVSHSHLISDYIKNTFKKDGDAIKGLKEKIDNNGVVKIGYTDTNGIYKPTSKLCSLMEGYRNKTGTVTQEAKSCNNPWEERVCPNSSSPLGNRPGCDPIQKESKIKSMMSSARNSLSSKQTRPPDESMVGVL